MLWPLPPFRVHKVKSHLTSESSQSSRVNADWLFYVFWCLFLCCSNTAVFTYLGYYPKRLTIEEPREMMRRLQHWDQKAKSSTSCFPLTKLTVGGRLTGEGSRGPASALAWMASLVNCDRSVIWGNRDWGPSMPLIGCFKMSRMWSTGDKATEGQVRTEYKRQVTQMQILCDQII